MTAIVLPKADAPAEEWGRLAVSLPGWPCHSVAQRRGMVGWLYGQSADVDWPIGGLRAMFIAEKGVTTLYHVVESGGYPQHRMRNGSHKFIPDPDDPATAGCLLALLGDRLLGVFRRGDEWIVRINGYAADHAGSTLGRACIAAAVLLGRWPGGEG